MIRPFLRHHPLGRMQQWLPILSATLALTLAGCNGNDTSGNSGSTSSGGSSPTSTSTSANLQGSIYGGRQPVTGSTVLVYESGLNPGDAPTQIASAVTDSNGNFSVSSFSPTPSSSQYIYVVAIGGNSGSGINANINLMNLAGTYGSLPATVTINELTTVAATSQLGGLLQEVGCSTLAGTTQYTGMCPSIAGSASLGTAMNNVTTLVDPTTGRATSTLTGASNGTAAYTALQTMNTLGSLLASCVNSIGGYAYNTGTVCGNLFSTSSLSTANTLAANGADITFNPYPDAMSGLAITPNGQFLIAIDNTGKIGTYAINQSTGRLTAKVSQTMAGTSPEPWGIAISPDGSHAYICDEFNGLIYAYSINASTGALTQTNVQYVDGNSSTSPNDYPDAVRVSPDGKYLYVVNSNSANIGVFSISGGTITHVTNTTVGNYPNMIVFAAGGSFAYVANSGDNTVTAFSVNKTTGVLSTVSTVAAGVDPLGIALTPDNRYAYVVNNGSTSSTVSIYNVNQVSGALSSLGTQTVSGSGGGMAYSYSGVVSHDGSTLYVISGGDGGSAAGGVTTFKIASSGTLTQKAFIAAGAPDTTDGLGSGATTLVISPNGNFAYTDNQNVDSISSFTVVPGAADTLYSGWSIANNSSINNAGTTLYNEVSSPLVYSPILSAAPGNWTITP